MLTIPAATTIRGSAGANTSIDYHIVGLDNAAPFIAQGTLTTSVATLHTATGTGSHISKILLSNTTAGAVVSTLLILTKQLVSVTIPIGGACTIGDDGWKVTDANGATVAVGSVTLTGDVTGTGVGSIATTLATVNSNVGSFGTNAAIPAVTVNAKGLVTAASSAAVLTTPSGQTPVGATRTITTTAPLTIDAGSSADLSANRTLALTTSPTGQTPVGITRLITATTPIQIDGTTSANLSADRTVSIIPATTALAGSMSAIDKLKLDNAWIDVTANTIALVTPAQSAATNTTNIGTILSGAANGSTIYFPKGTYSFSGAWTMPNKMFTFQGEGSNRAGSPATAFTELKWTSNVGATLIVIPGSGNGWYTRFRSLTFTTTVDQTVGGVIDANGNVGIDILECGFQSNGGFFNDVLIYGGGAGSNSANSTVVNDCHIQGYKGTGVRVNSAGSSLVISNTVVQGQWGTSAQMATAGISGAWVGALQINDCDVLGNVNNLLLNPVAANSEVCASVFCTNTYFDFSLGSCLKITGTGATIRARFDTCSFTTGTGATGLSAVEINSSFAYAVGGQGIDFVNCNILNTFATTGTTNGFLISASADYSIGNCRIAAWTNGVNHTPHTTSGRSQPQIVNNLIGATGGFAGNTVGILLNAGTNGSLQINGNTLTGNGTAITDNSTVTTTANNFRNIKDNIGFNPKSVVAQPAMPATTVAVFNSTGVDCAVYFKGGTTVTAITIGGVSTGITAVNAVAECYFVAANQQIAWTGTGAPTWVWIGS